MQLGTKDVQKPIRNQTNFKELVHNQMSWTSSELISNKPKNRTNSELVFKLLLLERKTELEENRI